MALWFCAVALGFSAHGQVVANWTGKGNDSLWTTAKNWDTHAVPGAIDTANIDLTGSNLVIINSDVVIGTINLGGPGTNVLQLAGVTIQCSGSISITSGGFLEITSSSIVAGGSLQNSGNIVVPANLGAQSLTLMCNFTNSGVLYVETNSVLSLPGTNSFTPQFLPGTAFTGSGAVQFPAGNAGINCLGSMAISGTVVEQQAVSGSSTWIGPGQFQWLSGSISNVTFGPSLTVELSTAGQKIVNGTCTNQGVMIWMPGADGFTPNANAEFFNSGLCQFENNCSLGSGTNGLFENTGTLQVPPNLGTVSLTLQCGFTNYGAVDVDSNSTFLVQRPLSVPLMYPSFESGTLFEGQGTLRFPTNSPGINNLPIVCNGTITINGTVELNVSQFGGALWTGSGLLRWWGSPMFNPTFAPGFHVEISNNDPKAIVGVGTNQGTIRLIGGDFSFYGQTGSFYNEGIFQMESNCNFTSGLTNFINSGTITVPPDFGVLSLTNTCNFTNYATIDVESNSILTIVTPNQGPTVPVQGTTAFESGTVFAGVGTVQFGPEGTLNCDGTITVNGTIVLTNVMQAGDAIWTGPGLLQLVDGGWMTNATFAPGFNVQIIGSDFKALDGICTNQGTIRVLSLAGLAAPYGGKFYNAGLLQIETNCYFSLSSLGNSSSGFENTGTIKIPPGLGEISLMTVCPFTNYGVIDVETNSTLGFPNNSGPFEQPILDFESGTVFAGPGTVDLVSGMPLYCHGTITVDGTLSFNSAQNGSAIWTGPGLLQFIGGEMTNVTFAPGFNVQLLGADAALVFDGACTNEGTIRVMNLVGLNAPDGGQFYNTGLLQIETNCYVSFVGFGASSSFQNTGTIKIPPGLGEFSLMVAGPFTNYGVIDVETNSTLDFNNSPGPAPILDFESGTVFAGRGTEQFFPGEGFSCDGTITVDGTIIFNTDSFGEGPDQSGNVIWTGPGLLQYQGGTMTDATFARGFNVQMLNSQFIAFEGACTNQGTIRVLGTGSLDAPDGGQFYNCGLFQIETNFYDLYNFNAFNNTGTIRVPPGLGTLPLTIDCAFINSGVIDVETNSELDISNGLYSIGNSSQTYLGGSTFNGSGTVSLMQDAGIACSGSITDNCALNLQSDMSGAPIWTGSGRFSWLSGAISNITFAPDFHAQISGTNIKFLTSVCTNQGTVCWLGGSQLNDSATSAQFYNSGTLQITTDGTWNNIPINNQAGGTFVQFGGTFSVPSFSNMGSVQAASGFLNVTSNFFSCTNSSYQLIVNGTTPGSNFNQLSAQNLALNGSLQVVLTNGFSPANGNSFAIMNGTRSGSFSSTILPAPQNNRIWSVQYAPALVVLEVGQPGGALTNMSFVNGTFQFSLNGFPSGSYDIQTSTNLIDWTTILTNYPFSGAVTVTDTNAAGTAQRFYRARLFP